MSEGMDLNVDKLLRLKSDDMELTYKHYEVTDSMVKESLEHIKEWYKMQPHLPQGALNDNILLRHLGIRGFSIERTKQKIDHYYNARNIMPELTTKRDPMSPSLQQAMDVIQIITVPQKTADNHRLTIYRFKNTDPSKAVVWDLFKLSFMIADYRLTNDMTLGEHIAIDLSGLKMGHVLQVTPSVITKSNFYTQSCIGAKFKGIHLVGLPSYGETMISMFKKGLPKKIAERVFTYSKFEDLKNLFPVQMLPKDMGGEEMSSDEIWALWRQTLESPAWRQWFIEQENVKTDESKRPAKSSDDGASAAELMGIHGSFRKLDLD